MDDSLIKIFENKQIVIFGAGYLALKFYKELVRAGLSKNLICFAVTKKTKEQRIDDFEVKQMDELEAREDIVVCIAAHEAIKDEMEKTLIQNHFTHSIWIWPYLLKLFAGEPIQKAAEIPVDLIIRQNRNYNFAIRYLAIENYYHENQCGYEIYKHATSIYSEKATAEKRLNRFCSLIQNWENRGYDPSHPVLLDQDGRALDGFHRISLAKYHHRETIVCDVYKSAQGYSEWMGKGIFWNREVFAENGFTPEELRIIEEADRKIRGEGYGDV